MAAAARPVQQPLRHGRVAGPRRRQGRPRLRPEHRLVHRRASTQQTGGVRWKTARPEAHSGHSTPILYKPAGGATQILVPGSFLLTAYAAEQRREAVVGRRALVRDEVDAGREAATRSTSTASARRRTSRARTRRSRTFDEIVRSSTRTRRQGRRSRSCRTATRARGSTSTRTRAVSRERVGLLQRGDGERERHARDPARRTRRHDRDQRALEVPQVGAAAALAAHLPERALHGERRRHRHDAATRRPARRWARAG